MLHMQIHSKIGKGHSRHPLPTKAYTMLVPNFEKHPLFADFGRKDTHFSTEIADFEAQ